MDELVNYKINIFMLVATYNFFKKIRLVATGSEKCLCNFMTIGGKTVKISQLGYYRYNMTNGNSLTLL